MKKIAFIILLAVIAFSCKKDPKTVTISGTLTDPLANSPVPNAIVSIQTNGVVDGVYHSGYVQIASTRTDANGAFSSSFEENAYDSYRINFVKSNYFTSQNTISASSLSEDSFNGNFNIYSKSHITLNIINANPANDEDEIVIYYNNPPELCDECVNAEKVKFTGKNINETLTGTCWGNYDITLIYSVTKNGNTTTHNQQLSTIPYDTTFYTINY